MKLNVILILCLLILSASKCRKESDKCHKAIFIKNNSNAEVLYGWNSIDLDGKCYLSLSSIAANGSYEWTSRDCWEQLTGNGSTEEFYIIDPSKANPQNNVSYDCDSIPVYNKVLKHYLLTIEYLRDNDFVINYP